MRSPRVASAFAVFALGSGFLCAAPLPGRLTHLRVADGDVAFTLVGQVTNSPPDKSVQVGYLPTISGLTGLFSSAPEGEATAFFTFVNDTRTTAVRHSGPITVIEREGTATIYAQSSPHGDFGDPTSFQGSDPVLVMSLKQQVVVDTGSKIFTVVIVQTVTDANAFEKDGQKYDLAFEGDQFRISFTGALNGAPPPSGFFSGYAVRIPRERALHALDRVEN